MLAFFNALGWTRIISWTVFGATLIGGLGLSYEAWHHKVYAEGYTAAIHEIVAENERAIDVARKARARWRNCTAADGMRWNQSTGQCERGDL